VQAACASRVWLVSVARPSTASNTAPREASCRPNTY
jgi:hypothetical protein